jgi:acyl carrier protein
MLRMDASPRATIRAFVMENLAAVRGRPHVDDADDLVETGVVDSLGIFQLVAFLEERFGIAIADEDITPENFGSIVAIDRLVAGRSR